MKACRNGYLKCAIRFDNRKNSNDCAVLTLILREHRTNKGTGLVSRRLIKKHVKRVLPTRLIPPKLGQFLNGVASERLEMLDSIGVAKIDAPGSIAYFTADAMHTLQSAKGFPSV